MKGIYELIVTVVAKGHSDEVVVASREAGAQGGTIIYGRGTSPKEKETILGLDLKGEKEVVLILAPSDKKQTIMEQISTKAKLNTTGKGLCFSLPIDACLGLKDSTFSQVGDAMQRLDSDSNTQKFDNMPSPSPADPKATI